MAVQLNHTIVHSLDPRKSADFLVEILGLAAPVRFGPFLGVKVANDVTLGFLDAEGMEIQMQHYSFLVSEAEFDQIFGRIKARGLDWWADPEKKSKGETYRFNGGRGLYFSDPSGHLMEIQTRPYVG